MCIVKYLKSKLAYLLIVVFMITPLSVVSVNAMEIQAKESFESQRLEDILNKEVEEDSQVQVKGRLQNTSGDFQISNGILVRYIGTDTNVTIPSTVTYIGEEAFGYNTTITSVTIPSSVTSMGRSAFTSCTNLTTVNLTEGLSEIGITAFKDCTNLNSITIPSSVTYIGNQAFVGCNGLAVDGLVIVNNVLYDYVGSASIINITHGVTTIGERAFSDCTSPVNIFLPGSVTKIEDAAFFKCTNLKAVSIPDGVTSIGALAFYECTSLETITIPETVTQIKNSTFYKCSSLTSVTLPTSVTSIGATAFYNCSNLETFSQFSSVTSIGSNAFLGCIKLADAQGFLIINHVLYQYSGANNSVTIPSNVHEIGSSAFANRTTLTDVVIPSSVTIIGYRAFYKCSGLTTITIPDTVTTMGNDVFAECTNLSSISLSNNITSLGWNTFYNCTSLSSITIPNKVVNIGKFAFLNCSNLISITFPNSLQSIEQGAFGNCTGLTNMTIPLGTTNLGEECFAYCTNLERVNLPETITGIGEYLFTGCTLLSSVNIPTSLTRIENYVFEECNSLTSITIPEGINEIGEYAFYNCGLTSIIIPSGVTTIEDSAFYQCTQLDRATILSSTTNIEDGAFDDCSSNLTFFCYKNSNAHTFANNERIQVSLFVESVRFKKSIINILKGQTQTLTVAVLPVEASNKNVKWTTSNPNVATVDGTGKIRGIATGVTIITVTTEDGRKTANCSINVTQAISKINLNASNATLAKKASIKLEATITPKNAANKNVTWTSSNTNIAVVDNKGKVTAISPGYTKITVAAADGSNITSNCMIKVLSNNSYRVKYNLNKGKNAVLNPTYYAQGVRIKLDKPSRKGYEFAGWYLGKKRITSISKSMKGNITLNAKWKKVSVDKTNVKSVKNKKASQVSISFDKVRGVKGYTVFYSKNKKLKNATELELTSKKKSASITNLEKGKTYYITVKGYKIDSKGNRVYGKSNKIFKIKINK